MMAAIARLQDGSPDGAGKRWSASYAVGSK